MQILVLAVQNAVPYELLGVGTSGVTLFRSVGGSLGTAILGAVFTASLAGNLKSAGLPGGGSGEALSAAALAKLPEPAHTNALGAFTDAIGTVLIVGCAGAAVAFLFTLLIREQPLRQTVTGDTADSLGAVTVDDSLRQVARGLARTVGRDRTRAFVMRIADVADAPVSPLACWTLSRLNEEPEISTDELADVAKVEDDRIDAAVAELQEHALIEPGTTLSGHKIAEEGRVLLVRLYSVRRELLADLVREWEPDEHPELAEYIGELADELGVDPPPHDLPALASAK
jgi:hypothetical protein